MNKKILILGAGIYQIPLIYRAKEMGLYTIVSSCAGPYPGFFAADEAWQTDTTDSVHLLQKAEQAGIDAVCTSGSDVCVGSVGYLCRNLHLNGIPFEAARLATDKAAMKDAFRSGNVSTPAAVRVSDRAEALAAFARMGAPVVLKAADSSGSRGITRADTEEELLRAWERARKVTHRNYVLIERFVSGHEIGVDGLICDGKIRLLLPHDKFTHTVQNTTLPAGHAFPFRCGSPLMRRIRAETEKAIASLGLDNCAFNADVLVTDRDACVLEMGGRAGATGIPELISIYTGMDYYEAIIRCALGERVTLPAKIPHTPCMSGLLFSGKNGTVTAIDTDAQRALAKEGVRISLDCPVGAQVCAVRNGTDRIGQVIAETDDAKELNALLSAVRHTIQIDGVDLEQIWNESNITSSFI